MNEITKVFTRLQECGTYERRPTQTFRLIGAGLEFLGGDLHNTYTIEQIIHAYDYSSRTERRSNQKFTRGSMSTR